MPFPLKAKVMSSMGSQKDVLIYGDITMAPITTFALNPSNPLPAHPIDDMWIMLDAPYNCIVGYDTDGISHKLESSSVKSTLLIEHNSHFSAKDNNICHIQAFSGTSFVIVHAPKYQHIDFIKEINQLSLEINQSDLSSREALKDANSRYLTFIEKMQKTIPVYWSRLFTETNSFIDSITTLDSESTEVMRGTKKTRSLNTVPKKGIYIATSANPGNAPKSGYASAHFSLVPANTSLPGAKKIMRDTIYAAARSPEILMAYFNSPDFPQELDGNTVTRSSKNKGTTFIIDPNMPLNSIFEAANTETIASDGCVKVTGNWSQDGNGNRTFNVTSVVMTPWSGPQ